MTPTEIERFIYDLNYCCPDDAAKIQTLVEAMRYLLQEMLISMDEVDSEF